jgi:DNA-binding protein Fis
LDHFPHSAANFGASERIETRFHSSGTMDQPEPRPIQSVAMAILLLIEADEDSRSALKGELQATGHIVHEAASLEDARVALRNLIEQTATLERKMTVEEEPIIPLEEVEFLMVQRALRATRGNQSQAARLLQVSRDQLRYRVKRYRELGRLAAGNMADELVQDESGALPSSDPTGSAAARSSESPLQRSAG